MHLLDVLADLPLAYGMEVHETLETDHLDILRTYAGPAADNDDERLTRLYALDLLEFATVLSGLTAERPPTIDAALFAAKSRCWPGWVCVPDSTSDAAAFELMLFRGDIEKALRFTEGDPTATALLDRLPDVTTQLINDALENVPDANEAAIARMTTTQAVLWRAKGSWSIASTTRPTATTSPTSSRSADSRPRPKGSRSTEIQRALALSRPSPGRVGVSWAEVAFHRISNGSFPSLSSAPARNRRHALPNLHGSDRLPKSH